MGDVFITTPILQPFNGSNSHSVIVLDNASVHHYHEVADIINGVGCIIRFLPPYSPELNPIENVFSNDTVYISTLTPRLLVSMFCNQK